MSPVQADLEDMSDLSGMRQELLSRAQAAVGACREHRAGLERYSHLYGEEDRKSVV